MEKLLKVLDWKKTTVGAILALIITYCLSKNYIDMDLALLLNWILVALWLSANIANSLKK